MFRSFILATLLSLLLPQVALRAEGPTTKSSGGTTLAPFSESIPTTLVTFDMIPIVVDGAKPFWIGKTELTWDAFDVWAFQLDLTQQEQAAGVDAKSRPSKPYGAPDKGFGHRGYPAIGMTLESAKTYCEWLSKKTGKKYRLPTVQEWQLACRVSDANAAVEVKPANLKKVAWYYDTADSKTHPVGKLAANAFGLHDMLGNVAEWAITPEGKGVVCGGSYDDDVKDISPNAIKPDSPAWQASDPQDPKSRWWLPDAPFVGMRVVCDP